MNNSFFGTVVIVSFHTRTLNINFGGISNNGIFCRISIYFCLLFCKWISHINKPEREGERKKKKFWIVIEKSNYFWFENHQKGKMLLHFFRWSSSFASKVHCTEANCSACVFVCERWYVRTHCGDGKKVTFKWYKIHTEVNPLNDGCFWSFVSI